MRTLILPLTKSPWAGGRVGPRHLQDWYQGVRKGVRLGIWYPRAKILVLTAVHIPGQQSEQACYREVLEAHHVPTEDIIFCEEAYETIEQIEIAERMADEQMATLVIISTWTHYPRVRWLCRGKGFVHYIAWGIPRPSDVVTDTILTILFPLIDVFGKRAAWVEWLKKRRLGGKL